MVDSFDVGCAQQDHSTYTAERNIQGHAYPYMLLAGSEHVVQCTSGGRPKARASIPAPTVIERVATCNFKLAVGVICIGISANCGLPVSVHKKCTLQ
jgi:hypothetical protein